MRSHLAFRVARALVLGVVLVCASAEAAPARSKTILHRVKTTGETYAQLADHYYGRRFLERHLRLYNRRKEPLKKGTSIIIPTYVSIPLQRGQSLEAFAGKYLQDPGRAPYLQLLHKIKRGRAKPGSRLRRVVSFKHTVKPGETLRSIAKAYYRDSTPRRVGLLALYNKMGKQRRLRPGRALRLPLDTPDFRHASVLKRARKPFDPQKKVAKAPKAPPPTKPSRAKSRISKAGRKAVLAQERAAKRRKLVEILEQSERLYSDGEYKACRKLTSKTLANAPKADDDKQVELLRLQAFSEIALGDFDRSKKLFKRLLELDPEYALDLYQTSPKILDIFNSVAMR